MAGIAVYRGVFAGGFIWRVGVVVMLTYEGWGVLCTLGILLILLLG